MKYNFESIVDINKIDKIWSNIDSILSFTPSVTTNKNAYTFFKQKYMEINIIEATQQKETNDFFEKKIIDLLRHTQEEYIFALRWQGMTFRYSPMNKVSPKIKLTSAGLYAYYEEDDDFDYLPQFFPDGDYFLYLTPSNNNGFFSDPWRKKIYIYGEQFKHIITNSLAEIPLTLKISQK